MKKTRHPRRFYLIPAVLTATLLAACLFLGSKAVTLAEEHAYLTLEDSAAEQLGTVRASISGYYSALNAYARNLEENANLRFDSVALRATLHSIQQNTDFFSVFAADRTGAAYSISGYLCGISDRGYALRGFAGYPALEHLEGDLISGQPCFVFSVPLYQGHTVIGLLGGTLTEGLFAQVIRSEAYGGQCVSFLCDASGAVILTTENSGNGTDWASGLSGLLAGNRTELARTLENLQRGKAGHLAYTAGSGTYFAAYRPLGVNGWTLFTAVSSTEVERSAEASVSTAYAVMGAVMALSLLLLLYVQLSGLRNQRRIELEREDIRVAAEQSGRRMLRYDFSTDTAFGMGSLPESLGTGDCVPRFHAFLLENELILPNSRADLDAFFAGMQAGEPTGSCDLQVAPKGRDILWFHADYTLVSGERGSRHAVIFFFDNTRQREKELAFEKWRTDLSALMTASVCYLEINLTRDTVERVEGRVEIRARLRTYSPVFSRLMQERLVTTVPEEEQADYLRFFNPRRLLSLYANSTFSDVLEFRSSISGTLQWYRGEIQMTRYPYSDDIKAFFILSDVDAKRQETERLKLLAQRDSLTNALNRQTMESMISQALAAAGKDDLSVMFLLDLDNLKQINDVRGHQAGDQALRSVAAAIMRTFRAEDIVGRLGGDEFMVFLPRCDSEALAGRKAAALVEATQFMVEDLNVTTSVGVALCRGGGKTFDALYREADIALYDAKSKGKSRYLFAESTVGPAGNPAGSEAAIPIQLQSLLENMDGGVILLDVGETLLVKYVSPSFFRSLSRTPDEFSPHGKPLLELVIPQDRELVGRALHTAAETGQLTDCVYRVETGGIFWHHMRLARLGASAHPATLIGVVSDITAIKQSEQLLRETEERYRIAVEQTKALIWEVDIPSRTLFQTEEVSRRFGISGSEFPNAPESILRLGVFHPDSEEEFRRMFEDIYAGRESREYVLLASDGSGGLTWIKTRYGLVPDADGLSCRAIGMTELLENIDFEMRVFQEELHFMELISSSLLGELRANISKDRVELCRLPLRGSLPSAYTELLTQIKAFAADGEAEETLLRQLSVDAILSQYRRGQIWILTEFRRTASDGTPRWTSIVSRLNRHPVSGDIYLFSYIRDAEVTKQWELALSSPPERDVVTLLYTRKTLERLFQPSVASVRKDRFCAISVYEITGLEQLKAERGITALQSVLLTLARLFRILINGDAAIGLIDEAHIAVLRTDLTSPSEQRARAESCRAQILNMLCQSLPGCELSLCCGYTTALPAEASFETMLHQATVACASARQTPGSQVAVYVQPESRAETAAGLPDDREVGQKFRILVADDDRLSRLLLCEILRAHYTVEQAEDGQQALEKMADAEYSLVLLDIQMPVKTGWEVLEQMRKDRRLASVPVVVVTSDAQPASEVQALNMGATDVIRKPYESEILLSRIHNIVRARESTRMEEQNRLYELRFQQQSQTLWLAEHDELTGLLNRQALYRGMRKKLAENPGKKFIVLRLDLDSFKVFNDVMGVDAGDQLLRDIGSELRRSCSGESVYGRIEADHFVDMIPADLTTTAAVYEKIQAWFASYPLEFKLMSRMGVYVVDDPTLAPSIMCDRALLALRSIKGSFARRIAYYDESLRKKLLEEQELSAEMVPALESGQFEVYFQPQYNYETGEIVGAEALVRWLHPKKGLISPNVFIPLFERNGFVSRLDEYVWEKSCIYLRRWRAMGDSLPQVGVSVNISRLDIYDPHLCERLKDLMDKYDLPVSSLKLEITESVYMQNPEQLIQVVRRL